MEVNFVEPAKSLKLFLGDKPLKGIEKHTNLNGHLINEIEQKTVELLIAVHLMLIITCGLVPRNVKILTKST